MVVVGTYAYGSVVERNDAMSAITECDGKHFARLRYEFRLQKSTDVVGTMKSVTSIEQSPIEDVDGLRDDMVLVLLSRIQGRYGNLSSKGSCGVRSNISC